MRGHRARNADSKILADAFGQGSYLLMSADLRPQLRAAIGACDHVEADSNSVLLGTRVSLKEQSVELLS